MVTKGERDKGNKNCVSHTNTFPPYKFYPSPLKSTMSEFAGDPRECRVAQVFYYAPGRRGKEEGGREISNANSLRKHAGR